MNDAEMNETRLDGESVFDGRLLRVRRDRVRLPGGNEASREYIVHPGAVAVVPLLDDGRVLLVRQYRYPLARVFVEVPAGKIDPGETELVCGQRELREETGYVADDWRRLGEMHPCIGYSDERIVVYLARGLRFEGGAQDADEALCNHPLPADEALALARSGAISDAKTLVALFWAEDSLHRATFRRKRR